MAIVEIRQQRLELIMLKLVVVIDIVFCKCFFYVWLV